MGDGVSKSRRSKTADLAAIVEQGKAVYESMTEEQRASVDEARQFASDYAALFVDRTRELDAFRRRLREEVREWKRDQRRSTGEKEADEGYAAGLGRAIFSVEEMLGSPE